MPRKLPRYVPNRLRRSLSWRLPTDHETRILEYARAHANPELLAAITVALDSAMRLGEILSMEWQDIKWDQDMIQVRLTKHHPRPIDDLPLYVRLSAASREALRALGVKSGGLVFGLTQQKMMLIWRTMMRALELDLHFHDLRIEGIRRLRDTAPEIHAEMLRQAGLSDLGGVATQLIGQNNYSATR
jgi:integrase